MCDDEKQMKHLEFIQGVITRMNRNSFQLKGMCITIVAALVTIFTSKNNENYLFIAIIPTVLFWFLDSFYLKQERQFIGIYNNVARLKNDVEIKPYEMPITKFKGGDYCYWKVFISKTQFGLYGVLVILLTVFGVLVKFKDCSIIINCAG